MENVHHFEENDSEGRLDFLRREEPREWAKWQPGNSPDFEHLPAADEDIFYAIGESREEVVRTVVKYVYGLESFGVKWDPCDDEPDFDGSWEITGVPEHVQPGITGLLEEPLREARSPEFFAKCAALAADPGEREPGVPPDAMTRREAEGRIWHAWEGYLEDQSVSFGTDFRKAVRRQEALLNGMPEDRPGETSAWEEVILGCLRLERQIRRFYSEEELQSINVKAVLRSLADLHDIAGEMLDDDEPDPGMTELMVETGQLSRIGERIALKVLRREEEKSVALEDNYALREKYFRYRARMKKASLVNGVLEGVRAWGERLSMTPQTKREE